MTYSVLTKVTNEVYHEQQFYLYKEVTKKLTTLSQEEAELLLDILNQYPNVFSESKIVPRDEDEIKLLEDFWGVDGRPLDFDFEIVSDDCPGIIDKLNSNFSTRITGIDRKDTVKQTFRD